MTERKHSKRELAEGSDADLDTDDLAMADAAGDASLERLSAGGDLDEDLSEDLGVDSIVGPHEAGLGGGLDQAEEARAGITDEEIEARRRTRRGRDA